MGNTNSEPIHPDTKGYHILKVRDNSPASRAGLEAYFDFIIAINEISLNTDPTIFPSVIKQNIKNPVLCTVFSSKSNELRTVTLIPDWWAEEKDGLIGCSVRYCDYNGAAMHVWHVVEITSGSPAEMAGLNCDTDYIVGTPDSILREQQDLYNLIAQRCDEKKAVKLFVYSTVSKCVRELILLPNREWGSKNEYEMIGAQLGYGALHRIPTEPLAVPIVPEMTPKAYEPPNSTDPIPFPPVEDALPLENPLPLPEIPMPSAPTTSFKQIPSTSVTVISTTSPNESQNTLSPHLIPLPPSRAPSPDPSSSIHS